MFHPKGPHFMSHSHDHVHEHGDTCCGAEISPAEYEALRKDDAWTGRVVVSLMVAIFVIGVIIYLIVAISAAGGPS